MSTIADHQIANADWYNAEMAKSLIDKVYFLDKVDADLFVDYGCANGEMLIFMAKVFPGLKLVGFDVSEEMIAEAKARPGAEDVIFTSKWDEVAGIVRKHHMSGGKSCCVLSSVIHEFRSYLTEAEWQEVWNNVWGLGEVKFNYVAIRDMMASRAASRPADPISVARVKQVFEKKHPGLIAQWEARWGSLYENWSLLHFFLTYRYTNSWEREYRENYLPVNYEDFLASIPDSYFPIFKESYTLPFLRRRVKEDFGIQLVDATHLKAVFELL